jgi:hypothetical protein
LENQRRNTGGTMSNVYQPGYYGQTGENEILDSMQLLFVGADGSSTYTDDYSNYTLSEGSTGANAQISTAQSVYGGSSLLLNGTDAYIITDRPCMPAVGDWTLEFWFRQTSASGWDVFWGQYDNVSLPNGRFSVGIENGNLRLFVGSGTSLNITGSGTTPLDTWAHAAFVREGNDYRGYLDGVLDLSGTTSQDIFQSTDSAIGRAQIASNPSYFAGYIDLLMYTSGIVKYSANFTPPTLPQPDPGT